MMMLPNMKKFHLVRWNYDNVIRYIIFYNGIYYIHFKLGKNMDKLLEYFKIDEKELTELLEKNCYLKNGELTKTGKQLVQMVGEK